MKNHQHLLFLALLFGIISCSKPQNQNNMETEATPSPGADPISFWLGTYTNSPEEGFHLVQFLPDSAKFKVVLTESDINNPSFVLSNSTGDLIYAVQEEGGAEGGSVCAFRYNSNANTIEKLSCQSTIGSGPCYLTLSPDEKFLFAGNYGSGDLAVFPIAEDGNIGEAVQDITHTGSSVNKDRQNSPHVHSLTFHPDGKKLFVADLGTDKVNIYDYTPDQAKPLSASTPSYFEVSPGAGPRHLTFNAAGDKIYMIHEMTSEVAVYDLNLETNKITELDRYRLTPDGFQGAMGAAEIRLSEDGRYLYASNRGDSNEIIVFKVDETSGTLSKIQTISSGGKTPRNFAISPDGQYLFAGNQGSNTLIAYERNPETGIIKMLDAEYSIPKPVYFFMVK